jgi:hypothetical protein
LPEIGSAQVAAATRIRDLALCSALDLSRIGFAHSRFLFVARVIAAGRSPEDKDRF